MACNAFGAHFSDTTFGKTLPAGREGVGEMALARQLALEGDGDDAYC